MPDWLYDMLNGPSTQIAAAIWNVTMRMICGVITRTPEEFSEGTWDFVTDTLYPWSQNIGLAMLNTCLMIAFFQAVSNFHQNITQELLVEAMVKIVVCNVLFLQLPKLMTTLFGMAELATGELFTLQAPVLTASDNDFTAKLFYWLFGALMVLVAVVCSIMMLLTVYGRYLKLYMLYVTAPLAAPLMVGGHGMEASFYGWLKAFLLNCFEVVVIAMTMVLAWRLIGSGFSLFSDEGLASYFDGGLQALNGLFTMILMTVSVKGANSFLAKTFRL